MLNVFKQWFERFQDRRRAYWEQRAKRLPRETGWFVGRTDMQTLYGRRYGHYAYPPDDSPRVLLHGSTPVSALRKAVLYAEKQNRAAAGGCGNNLATSLVINWWDLMAGIAEKFVLGLIVLSIVTAVACVAFLVYYSPWNFVTGGWIPLAMFLATLALGWIMEACHKAVSRRAIQPKDTDPQ